MLRCFVLLGCLLTLSLQLRCFVGETEKLAKVDCKTLAGVDPNVCSKYELQGGKYYGAACGKCVEERMLNCRECREELCNTSYSLLPSTILLLALVLSNFL